VKELRIPTENLSVVEVLTDIRTEDTPKTDLELYRNANLLGFIM
jgi:hypothetical protein